MFYLVPKEVILKVSSQWTETALLMDYKLSETQNIKKKCGNDPMKCFAELFKRRLQLQDLENLLPILEEVLDSGTFENIEKAHAASGMHVKLVGSLCVQVLICMFSLTACSFRRSVYMAV